MPTVPRQETCGELGCNNQRTLTRFCLSHGGRDKPLATPSTKERKEHHAQYNTVQWQRLRRLQLSKHPLCVSCLSIGIVKQADQLDHLFPWGQISKQAFYINLFQSLCMSCHSSKTTMERRGIYRHYTNNGYIDYCKSDYNSVCVSKIT